MVKPIAVHAGYFSAVVVLRLIRKGMLTVLLLTGAAAWASDSLIFVIRVDDIQSRTDSYLPRSIVPFEEAVAARGARITWAVIPHRLTEPQNSGGELSAELRRSVASGHEVVMHGYNHICPLCNYSNHEMYCTTYRTQHSYATQEQMIGDGLRLLQDSIGVSTACFVPPGHQADTLTYRVLLDFGFRWISTGGPSKQNIYKTLYNLSPQLDYAHALSASFYKDRLEEVLADVADQGEHAGYYCLLLHDPYIRPGFENGLVIRWTAELLDSLITRYGNRISFKTLSQAAAYFYQTTTEVTAESHKTDNAGLILGQNFPNPFNQRTTIPFYLKTPGAVHLTVYDIRGCVISALILKSMGAGRHTLYWDARDTGSGTYFYRLDFLSTKGTRSTETKRLLLIR